MTLRIDSNWLLAVQLTSMRLGVIFLLAPGFASFRVPSAFRIFFVIAISVGLVSLTGVTPAVAAPNLPELMLLCIRELVIGAAFAFGLFTAFGAFLLGGRLLDLQIGYGIASVIDPSTQAPSSLLGTALNLMAVAVFFSFNGHHHLIRAVAYSLELLPPGSFLDRSAAGLLIAQFGTMFTFGLALVAPAVFCLLLVDLGLAFIARTMPQMNVFILSMPIKVFVGLSALALTIPFLSPVLGAIFASMLSFWQKLLGTNG